MIVGPEAGGIPGNAGCESDPWRSGARSCVRLALACAVVVAGLGAAPPAVAPPTAPREPTAAAESTAAALDLAAPIPQDSSLAIGRLPNGLTYYVHPNGWPENRIEMRLVVRAGSVLEEDDQRGLAHFVEHMAFNGSEHFPPGEVVRYFESIGARFGPDLNAGTACDQTTYRLDVPASPESLLDRGLLLLSDFAARVDFAAAEVEKERGVLLEEWRQGLGASQRMRRSIDPVLYHGSRYAERDPIGDPAIIERSPPQRQRDFYQKWYRPERMAVVVAGSVTRERAAALVRAHFAAIPPSTDLAALPAYEIPPHTETLCAIATDPEARVSSVSLVVKRPRVALRTLADLRQSFVRGLFFAMLNERFVALARIPEAPFLSASAGGGALGRTVTTFSVTATTADGGLGTGLRALVLELRRLQLHGFGAAELERAKASLLASYERAYKERDRVESRTLAGRSAAHFLEGTASPGIESEYALLGAMLPGIGLEDVDAARRDMVRDNNRVVIVRAPEKKGLATPSEAELGDVVAAPESVETKPWFDEVADRPLLEPLPAAGTVTARREIAAIGVTVLTLGNGVDVWLKPTDFKNDEILFSCYAPGGGSLAEPKRYQEALQATAIVRECGVGGLTPIQITKLLAGKLASAGPFLGNYSHGVSGASTPADLETALQLLYLYFTQPTPRPEAVEVVRKWLRISLANRAQDPEAAFADAVARVNSRDHYMARPLAPETVERLALAPALEFYRARFANAADFTFFFVGAFDPQQIEPLLVRYVGALPSAGRRQSRCVDRGYAFPRKRVEADVRKGQEPKSRTALTFFADAGRDEMEIGRAEAAGEILQTRLREILREDLGTTYSVGVGYSSTQPMPGYGTMSIGFGGAPENRDRMVAATLREIARLREEGPTEADLATFQELGRRELELAEKRNGYWLASLQRAHMLGWDPAGIARRREMLGTVTRADVQAAFAKYFPDKRSTRVSLLPGE